MKKGEMTPLRVLGVADQDDVRELYDRIFKLQNRNGQSDIAFELTTCSLKPAAAEKVQESIDRRAPLAVALIHFAGDSIGDVIETAERIRTIDPWVNLLILEESPIQLGEIRERVPPAGKLFIIKKPFDPWAIQQLTEILGALWRSEKELQRVNSEMQAISRELLETNDALSVLARNLENSRRQSETRMIQRIRTLIMPVIQKLRHEKGLKRFKPDLDLLSAYIESLTADLATDLKVAAMLSRAEHQVASLIKNGMTSDEIAAHLNISLFTVKTHRKNIRKKLDIQNSGVNLRSFLESGLKEK